jgi:hypothetical protein
MINSVRTTVLAAMEKDNNGYMTPANFNRFAKQAQLSVFEDEVYRYNDWLVKRNAKMSGSGNADIVQNIEETLEDFTKIESLTGTAGEFALPSDAYYLTKLIYGATTDVEKVSNGRAYNLLSSINSAPDTMFPIYTKTGSNLNVYPTTINNVNALYIRYPKDPKWTYVEMSEGEPLFNASATDYQDFEMPMSYEPLLVHKILQYAGVSIRDADIVNSGVNEERKEKITKDGVPN